MAVALVTNYIPPYRVPLYTLLAERYGVEVHCFGGEASYVPKAMRDLDRQLAEAPFPAHRLARERDAHRLGATSEVVIASTAGRVALPAAYRGARRADTPFVLWASLWRHPLTLAHVGSLSLMRRIYKRADAVLTYGDHVSRYVRRHRKKEEGIFTAPQAVEADIFGREVGEAEQAAWRAEAGLPATGPVVLFVGRLAREKGVDVLLRAWHRLRPEEATLCLVGDGPRAGRMRGPQMVLAGRLERERLPVAYATARFVVVPSIETRRFLEPWGLVCNEAMYQGTPVIASSAVGAVAGALVTHGGSGLVVRPEDDRELAAAMGSLLEDDALHARLARVARSAVEPFNYEAAAAAFGRALEFARASAA
jgi:glycosyltransferase involved in cell wall biosynthesis